MNFKDEFYQKLKLLVLPIAIQNFMLALVSATDAIMLGLILLVWFIDMVSEKI